MLPGEFAPWRAAHYYFRRWREEGRILCILSITSRAARRRSGRHGEPSALIVDCQSVPSARTGGIRSFDAFRGGPWPETTYCCPCAGTALGPGRLSGRRSRNAVGLTVARSGRLSIKSSGDGLCGPSLSRAGRGDQQRTGLEASDCRIRRRLWILRRAKTMDRGANLRVVRRMAPAGPRAGAAD
jgi:hypothetical protein